MTQRDDRQSLRHMIDHAEEAIALLRGRTREGLDADRLLSLALVRLCEVVGEAAYRLTDSTKLAYPTLPWKQIINFRHRLIHGYDAVDLDRCGRS